MSTVQSASEADNAFVFINTNSSGGAVSGQVAPSQYTVTAQAGLFGVFDPGTSAYGDGVLGLSYTGNGVVGQALSGNYSGVFGEAQGSATGPGVEGIGTTSSAVGVLGASNYTTAILGSTGQTTSTVAAGVEGQDVSNAGEFNDGVLGTTTNGGYGVEGTSGDGALGGTAGSGTNKPGVLGFSTSSYGVYGASTSGDAGHFISTSLSGVYGQSGTSYGAYFVGEATATPEPTACPCVQSGVYGQSVQGQGVYGVNLNTTGIETSTAIGYDRQVDAGVFGYGNAGPGVQGYSHNDIGVYAQNNNTNFPTIFAENEAGTATDGIAFYAYNDVTGDITIADSNGNFTTSGSITSESDTYQARTRNPNTDLMTYSAQHTEATIEDFGTAQLVGGSAAVPLAADFRQTMNPSMSYMVFLTPNGDNRGLYVASKTPEGFVVKEAQSGRSTLAFDYRIVAHPYGSLHARLPHLASLRVIPTQATRARLAAYGKYLGLGNDKRMAEELALKATTSPKALRPRRFAKTRMPSMPPAMNFTTR